MGCGHIYICILVCVLCVRVIYLIIELIIEHYIITTSLSERRYFIYELTRERRDSLVNMCNELCRRNYYNQYIDIRIHIYIYKYSYIYIYIYKYIHIY